MSRLTGNSGENSSDTDCETCKWVEALPRQRAMMRLSNIALGVLGKRENVNAQLMRTFAETTHMILGPSTDSRDTYYWQENYWYRIHREDWEKSGDILQLQRMKRHVTPDFDLTEWHRTHPEPPDKFPARRHHKLDIPLLDTFGAFMGATFVLVAAVTLIVLILG